LDEIQDKKEGVVEPYEKCIWYMFTILVSESNQLLDVVPLMIFPILPILTLCKVNFFVCIF